MCSNTLSPTPSGGCLRRSSSTPTGASRFPPDALVSFLASTAGRPRNSSAFAGQGSRAPLRCLRRIAEPLSDEVRRDELVCRGREPCSIPDPLRNRPRPSSALRERRCAPGYPGRASPPSRATARTGIRREPSRVVHLTNGCSSMAYHLIGPRRARSHRPGPRTVCRIHPDG